MKYKRVTVGGTFDHFHKGHRQLLKTTFAIGEEVWLGITSDTFISRLKHTTANLPTSIATYQDRYSTVKDYLQTKNLLNRAHILPIDDKFGTTLTDEKLEAIVVSPETELIATEINLDRAQKSWSALEVIVVPWVLDTSGNPIHSIKIRAGKIDREGNVFDLPKSWGIRYLPQRLRKTLKNPFGKLLLDSSKNHEDAVSEFATKYLESGRCNPFDPFKKNFIISVGDAVTDALVKIDIIPDISIVDLFIQRKRVYKNIEELGLRNTKVIRKVKNPAGTLSFSTFYILKNLLENEAKPAVMQVNGEDDLLTLFAVFLAPLGSLIVYGQPNEGIVIIEVSEENKLQVQKYLLEFTAAT